MTDIIEDTEKVIDLELYRESARKGLEQLTHLRAITAIKYARELLDPYLELAEVSELAAIMELYEAKLASQKLL